MSYLRCGYRGLQRTLNQKWREDRERGQCAERRRGAVGAGAVVSMAGTAAARRCGPHRGVHRHARRHVHRHCLRHRSIALTDNEPDAVIRTHHGHEAYRDQRARNDGQKQYRPPIYLLTSNAHRSIRPQRSSSLSRLACLDTVVCPTVSQLCHGSRTRRIQHRPMCGAACSTQFEPLLPRLVLGTISERTARGRPTPDSRRVPSEGEVRSPGRSSPRPPSGCRRRCAGPAARRSG